MVGPAATAPPLMLSGVRVTLPTRIEIAGPTTTVARAAVFGQARQTGHHVELAVADTAVRHPGEGYSSVVGGSHAVGTADVVNSTPAFAGTRVTYRLLPADRFTRTGDVVTVFGAARSHHVTDGSQSFGRHRPRVGARVDL